MHAAVSAEVEARAVLQAESDKLRAQVMENKSLKRDVERLTKERNKFVEERDTVVDQAKRVKLFVQQTIPHG